MGSCKYVSGAIETVVTGVRYVPDSDVKVLSMSELHRRGCETAFPARGDNGSLATVSFRGNVLMTAKLNPSLGHWQLIGRMQRNAGGEGDRSRVGSAGSAAVGSAPVAVAGGAATSSAPASQAGSAANGGVLAGTAGGTAAGKPPANSTVDAVGRGACRNSASSWGRKEQEALRWHRRLAHAHGGTIAAALEKGMVLGVEGTTAQALRKLGAAPCEPCILGKKPRAPFPARGTKEDQPLALVHMDLCGPIRLEDGGWEPERYMLTLVDDCTGLLATRFMRTKSEVPLAVQHTLAELELRAQGGARVRAVQTDRGTEFNNCTLHAWYKQRGIRQCTSAPYTPQQNGKAERAQRTVIEGARTLLVHSGLPRRYWMEAARVAVVARNVLPQEGRSSTPFELFTGSKPDISAFQVFGCVAYVRVPEVKRTKLEDRFRKGTFLGYEKGTAAWRVEVDGEVIASRDVVFDEGTMGPASAYAGRAPAMEVQAAGTDAALLDGLTGRGDQAQQPGVPAPPQAAPAPQQPAPAGQQAMQQAQQGVGGEADPGGAAPQEAAPRLGVRVSQRANKGVPPERYRSAAVAAVADGAAAAGVTATSGGSGGNGGSSKACGIPVPQTYEEAMGSDQREQWQLAMDEEMACLLERGTWRLVEPPPGAKVIKGKWVYSLKLGPKGELERFKARYVAKGCSQREGVDYTEVFAPTGRSTTLRSLLAIAAAERYVVHQLDVKTAYLYGDIEEEVYVQQPPGYVTDASLACRLEKALYGTRQGARAWNKKLTEEMREMGFEPTAADPSLFVGWVETAEGSVRVLVHVDDMLIAAPTHGAAEAFKAALGAKFAVKDLGVAKFFLGMEIEQRDGEIVLSQKRYSREIVEEFGMGGAAPAETPMEPGFQWGRSGEDEPFEDGDRYRSAVGALLYLANNTRPDLAFSVGVLARHMAAPSVANWAQVKRVLRYVKGTADKGLHFGGQKEPWFEGYSDSDWGQDPSRRSTTGYVFTLNGAAVSWQSTRQRTVATSTMEAEYQAAASASREGLWLRQLGGDFGLGLGKVQVWGDNSAALSLIKNPIVSNRSKHIDIVHHFVRERHVRGEVVYEYCPTASNVADVLTKALPVGDFVRFRAQLGVR